MGQTPQPPFRAPPSDPNPIPLRQHLPSQTRRNGRPLPARPQRPQNLHSLKAGGVGLNLTRANHVFHFDRWWNPAVENQATDRAFRIGQNENVQVHKFVTTGTLEERINDMINSKKALAEQVCRRRRTVAHRA